MAAEKRQRGRPIQFSEPKSTDVITNLNQLGSKKDGLRQLEEELAKSLQSFSPKGSLDGMMAPRLQPMTRPTVPNSRTKDAIDRQKNWIFLTPEELGGAVAEDPFKSSAYEPNDKKKLSPMERYFERLDNPPPGSSVMGPSGGDGRFDSRKRSEGADAQEEANLPMGLRDSEQNLRRLLDSEQGSTFQAPLPNRGNFADFFGLGDAAGTPEQIAAHRVYIKQYQELLNGPPPATDALTPLGSTIRGQAVTPMGGLGPLNLHPQIEPTPGTLTSPLNFGALPNENADLLNRWNPMYTPPQPQPPKPMPHTSPVTDLPRRKFM